MKKNIQILTVCGLTVCMACAQEKTGSVESVMKELNAYQGIKTAATVTATAPVAATPVAVAPALVARKPAEPVDVPALLEKSRDQFVAGNREGAEAGLKKVLIKDPDNKTAALYLRQIAGDRHQLAEEKAMDMVNGNWDGLEMRYFPLEGKILQNLGLADAKNPVHVEAKFPFVKFPKGTSAVYRPGLRKLFVQNTPENLALVQEIIVNLERAEQQAAFEQVEIQTRFVEFSEGALQELGFNWSDAAGSTYNLAGNNWKIGDATGPGQNLFSDSLRSVPFAQTDTLGQGEVHATGEWRANRIDDMFNDQAGILGLKGKVAGNPVDLLIKALDQTAGVDVLSAPSVVTLSGDSAVITVGERHFYPETYEAGESVGAVLHVKYDFVEKLLGVEMTVTPVINGDDIQLKINPRITELLGWQQFEISPADTSYTSYQGKLGLQFEHEPIVAKLPIFNRREVKTEISVASGATIGMGGLIGEKKESFSDRVPVLGSIPLVGRLFRSEGERNVKRNLMIFVTASKVAPNGRITSERTFEK
jgi:type II secretory pathway component GspD/PulD (secretin)